MVSRSGFYKWLKPSHRSRKLANQELDERLLELFTFHKGRYGVPRMHQAIKKSLPCSKNRVARRMKELNLQAKRKKRFKITTQAENLISIPKNILNREFNAVAINQKWVSDITYIRTKQGWVYLACVIDLCSRAVIGWSIQAKSGHQLVIDALRMALIRRNYPKQVIIHSDRGNQYRSSSYYALIKKYDLIYSMSRLGNCWDNAVVESFFSTLKKELVYKAQYQTKEEAELSIFEYIEVYFNRYREHSSIGFLPPAVFECTLRKK